MSKEMLLSAEELGNKLLQSVKEMKAGKTARVSHVEPNEVAEARGKTGLTQREFAEVLHISPRTLQEWEQGRRKPSGPAKALIEIAFRHPEVIREDFGLRR
ncbi:helix-turn-helix domain-containing protein [Halomonas sp. GFAJ-1]|uniref:helix-turn-helix domain-containing protein n=1 Tax=Halomonas sp. GFAJ-1 TaxID=1118153 RepID=UPI00023A2F10|nr:helix-turn-helix domain-containing protein [Halomonas sp. GFAJ-1]AVI63766.1 transcriptional regulator [Halomonas sp. GFAJ-1]EHK60566.1 XRE family transcriptional regulator [Halomonas sp. GFAJ-1]